MGFSLPWQYAQVEGERWASASAQLWKLPEHKVGRGVLPQHLTGKLPEDVTEMKSAPQGLFLPWIAVRNWG